ncbi:MAG: glycosyltransferase family 2 protein [Flavobacteriales bacterium]|nr:glycosyltransferase family 2 protein [Flavobacteriales bacterium]
MSITFSIIIPTYNRGYMIAETIDSVQVQTFADWECIVVDDGSTDNTKEVITLLAEKDPRIKYVYQENAERSVARNNGIRHSNGTYVCFLDSDDQYCDDYLETLNQFIKENNNPVGLIVSDYYVWTEQHETPAKTPSPSEPVAEWIFRHPITPSRACVHRSVFSQFMFDEETLIVEDSVLWVSISTKFEVLFLDRPLVKYRVHDSNSVNRSSRAAFHRYLGLKKFFKSPLSSGISNGLKRELISSVRWRCAEYFFLTNKFIHSITWAIWSVCTLPKHRHTKAKLYLIWQNVLCILRNQRETTI